MNDQHYAITQYTSPDGWTVYAGDHVKTGEYAFGWAVILGFSPPDKWGDVYCRLARPYAKANGVGTTGPNVMLGCETYHVAMSHQSWKDTYQVERLQTGSKHMPIIMVPMTIERAVEAKMA